CAVAVIIFILGLGTLLPWSFIIATEYFDDRLKGTTSSNGTTPLTKDYNFASWMTLLAQLPLFTLANSFLYQRIKEKVRIAVNMVSILFLFLLTAIMVKVPMQPHSCFSITMVTIWFINSFGAVLQGSLFGLVGLLPPRYSTLFMSGQGLAGIFAALASLFSILSKADKASAALGYFITPCVATLLTLLSYLLLPHLVSGYSSGMTGGQQPVHLLLLRILQRNVLIRCYVLFWGFARFYFEKNKEKIALVNGDLNGFNNKPIITNGDLDASGTKEALFMMAHLSWQSSKRYLVLYPTVIQISIQILLFSNTLFDTVVQIWQMALCVTCVLAVTLSVFPAVTVKVKSVYVNKEWDRYFLCVCCFIVFNVMDLIGRSVTSMVQWPSKRSGLFPVLVVSRVIFIPLIMLCKTDNRQYLPVLFSHDVAFVVIMTLFALSNGYFVCLCMSPQCKSWPCSWSIALLHSRTSSSPACSRIREKRCSASLRA
ncbi:unnamed protein product, partial [Coregonus sp. 'balchen']